MINRLWPQKQQALNLNFMKVMFPGVFVFLLLFFGEANVATDRGYVFLIKDSIPSVMLGNFIDDYNIHYNISDSLWMQYPDTKYHILKWNVIDQYIIARNDTGNSGDGGLYTRIDYMPFENMKPYLWGYCFTVYNAKSDHEAEATASADRQNPKKGCSGFPFSRMKKTEN